MGSVSSFLDAYRLNLLSAESLRRLVYSMFDLDGSSRTDLSLLDDILGDVIDFDRSSARLCQIIRCKHVHHVVLTSCPRG